MPANSRAAGGTIWWQFCLTRSITLGLRRGARCATGLVDLGLGLAAALGLALGIGPIALRAGEFRFSLNALTFLVWR